MVLKVMPKGRLSFFALAVFIGIVVAPAGSPNFGALISFPVRPSSAEIAAAQAEEQSASRGQGTLRVSVASPSGRKIAGAALSFGPEGRLSGLKALPQDDGTYLSSQLAAGRFRIRVVAPCYQPWQGSVQIESNHEQTLNVVLQPSSAAGKACVASPEQVNTDVQFSDSADLKPGGISGSVDAGGYSSQTQGAQMRNALGELAGGAESSNGTQGEAGSNAFGRGKSLLLQGKYQQAIGIFQQGAAQDPRSGELLLGLGVAYYSSGRYGAALDALLKAVDLNPSNRAAYFFLAQTYAASPLDTAAVLSRFESYAKRQPQNAAAEYYYALCLWRSGAQGQTPIDMGRVEQALRAAIALDPSLADAHYQLGVVLAGQRQDAQAIAEFERTIALQPEFAEAHYHLAQLYQRTGEKARAQVELAAYDQLRKQVATGDQRLRADVRRLLLGGGATDGN